jgi:hypothetical protein
MSGCPWHGDEQHALAGTRGASLIGALALLMATWFAAPAAAGPVSYSTSTSQMCVGATGCGVAAQTIGSVVVTYRPVPVTIIDASPQSFSSFGEIEISCVGGGAACANQSLAGLNLYLNITQAAPLAGSASVAGGIITGSIRGTASTAVLSWSVPNAVAIGPIRYAIANTTLALVPPSTNGGRTSVQAVLTDEALVFGTATSQLCIGAPGCGVNQQTIGNVTIRFEPVTASRIEVDPSSFASLGRLVTSCVGGGIGCGSSTLSGLNLYINITQNSPTSGNASLAAAAFTNLVGADGAVSGTGSTARLAWSGSTSAAIGPLVYLVANNPLAVVPPSTNGGVTSIQARIVREPLFSNGFE